MTALAETATGGRTPKQFFWNGKRVPYIVPWSGEQPLPGKLVHRRGPGGLALGYADEIPGDRFRDVLWIRMSGGLGKGRPNMPGVDPLRQRRCVNHFLCQVCGCPTERRDGRHLFLMHAAGGRAISEGERTQTPPVHGECAREAVRDCPPSAGIHRGTGGGCGRAAPGGRGITVRPSTVDHVPDSGGTGAGRRT